MIFTFLVGIIIILTGGPLGFYEFFIGFFIKDYDIGVILTIPIVISGSLLILILVRFFL